MNVIDSMSKDQEGPITRAPTTKDPFAKDNTMDRK